MNKQMSIISKISKSNNNKILFLVADGLGGMCHPEYGNKSELEYANLPAFDKFAADSQTDTGLIYPVIRGVIPGSGSGHFGLFGYDPTDEEFMVGRGALEAADLEPGLVNKSDIVARFNFCTLHPDGRVADRRAGRIANGEEFAKIINENVKVSGYDFNVIATKGYRGVLVIRDTEGKLSDEITDTDPQQEGLCLLKSAPRANAKNIEAANRTAHFVNEFNRQVTEVLHSQKLVNGLVIRGFSRFPTLPRFDEIYSTHSLAIASFPFYRGIAYLLGMDIAHGCLSFEDQIQALKNNYDKYDFFFLHYKDSDCRGEDRNFIGKVQALEYLDSKLDEILSLGFDTVVITGDHSTPSLLGAHSHHAVPLAINSKRNRGMDESKQFDERTFSKGYLGTVYGKDLMMMVLAAAGRLAKSEDFI